MVEDVVVLQLSMSVVVEVHPDLFSRMYPISPQHGRAARRYPHTGQSISIHFVLFDQTLAFFVHVYTAVLTVVYLVVSNYGITVSPDLYAGQGVAVYVVVFD